MLGDVFSNRGRNPLIWLAPQAVPKQYQSRSGLKETNKNKVNSELVMLKIESVNFNLSYLHINSTLSDIEAKEEMRTAYGA